MKKYKLTHRIVATIAALVFLLSLIVVAAAALQTKTEEPKSLEAAEPVTEPAPIRATPLVLLESVSAARMHLASYAAHKNEIREIQRDYAAESQALLEKMEAACLSGDHEAGRAAGDRRREIIESQALDEGIFTYDNLYLLSKLITAEAGSSWLGQDWRLRVGEVLLNRVASPEFPDSIEEVLYQPGQYYSRSNRYFQELEPYDYCVEAASRLLCGERIINDPSVVFQANFIQGSGIYLCMEDRLLGNTYLCYSNHPDLYEGDFE